MKSLKKATGWIIAGVAALLIIVAATSATTIVPAGHAGVVVTMGSVSNRVLDEGLHFKVPFVQQVVMMNNKIQKTEVAEFENIVFLFQLIVGLVILIAFLFH